MDYREDHVRGSDRRDRDRRDYDRRDYDHRRGEDRGFLERLVDELRSWFREGESRRGRGRWGGGARGWGAGSDEEVDREWERQWGYVDRGGGRRRRERSGESPRYGHGSDRYAGDRYDEPRSGWGDPSGWGAEPGSRAAGVGPHAGRGPRGYQRSDERIREDVCDILCDHGYIDASEIEVTVLNGEVTLIGVVRERPEKRMAEDAAEQVSGVRDVHNQLRVSPGGSGQEPPGRPGDPRFRVA